MENFNTAYVVVTNVAKTNFDLEELSDIIMWSYASSVISNAETNNMGIGFGDAFYFYLFEDEKYWWRRAHNDNVIFYVIKCWRHALNWKDTHTLTNSQQNKCLTSRS